MKRTQLYLKPSGSTLPTAQSLTYRAYLIFFKSKSRSTWVTAVSRLLVLMLILFVVVISTITIGQSVNTRPNGLLFVQKSARCVYDNRGATMESSATEFRLVNINLHGRTMLSNRAFLLKSCLIYWLMYLVACFSVFRRSSVFIYPHQKFSDQSNFGSILICFCLVFCLEQCYYFEQIYLFV